jgi:hypothetical protein
LDTKLKGDIAEQAVVLEALKRGWVVLQPIGDRLPYDLVLQVDDKFIRVQVKSAWWDKKKDNYVVDVRRTKTNRRKMIRDSYKEDDFDFAILYIQEVNIFYIMPADIFNSYGSEIHLVESEKRQRKPESAAFREKWDILCC